MSRNVEYLSASEFVKYCNEFDIYITKDKLIKMEENNIFKPIKNNKYHKMQIITVFLIIEGIKENMTDNQLKGYSDDFQSYFNDSFDDIDNEEKKALFFMGYSVVNKKIIAKQKALNNLSNLVGKFYLERIGK